MHLDPQLSIPFFTNIYSVFQQCEFRFSHVLASLVGVWREHALEEPECLVVDHEPCRGQHQQNMPVEQCLAVTVHLAADKQREQQLKANGGAYCGKA